MSQTNFFNIFCGRIRKIFVHIFQKCFIGIFFGYNEKTYGRRLDKGEFKTSKFDLCLFACDAMVCFVKSCFLGFFMYICAPMMCSDVIGPQVY